MDFVKDLGRKRENKKTSQIENKNMIENYNALVEKYNEINTFSEQVVEKYNNLVEPPTKIIPSIVVKSLIFASSKTFCIMLNVLFIIGFIILLNCSKAKV